MPKSSFSKPPRPHLAVPPRPGLWLFGRRSALFPSLWSWPLILSVVMMLGVMTWLHAQERASLEGQRSEMISDALSLEAQISAMLDAEQAKLKALSGVVEQQALTPEAFMRHALVLDGLRRFWVSVTWLNEQGRIVAQVPDDTVPMHAEIRRTADDAGLTGHLSAGLVGAKGEPAGMLVARYAARSLLRQKVPWWLASKYDIRLVDESDDVIASTTERPRAAWQAWYRVPMGPSLPQAWLELSALERITPWWRTMPMALMSAAVLLLVFTSLMLRKQMHSVSRAEEAWRTEAAWRTAMEDSLAVGIRARDLEGRLVYVNKTMADMVGYQPEELIGLMPPMPYWVPTELEESMSRHLRNMAGRAPREGYESRWQHRDGHVVEVMVFEAPLVDAKGRQIGWMASILNVTERKHMEERERKQLEAMAHHARLTMLGEVASTLAHELNQPLSAILSYNTGVLNMMQRHPQAEPELLKALERMGEQAAHAGRIVKRIREFLTRREPQREPFEIRQVIDSALSLLRRDIARHQVQVEAQAATDLPRVVADPILIEQVVVNLVRNACDVLADVPGARRITIHAERAHAGQALAITVQDNGPGFGAVRPEQLFSPFYSTKAEGMGMGLAICRSVIELHYGRLDAANVPGGGAAFTFTLPIETSDDGQDDQVDETSTSAEAQAQETSKESDA
ncbi:MAG: PAS domain S-box protein [Aquabacterium sp.]